MWLIARHEAAALLRSPLVWLTAAVSQFLLAWQFLVLLDRYRELLEPRLAAANSALGVTELVITPYLSGTPMLAMALLVATVFGMRGFTDERRQGTLALLLSAPRSSAGIAFGKYLGVLAVILLVAGLWWLLPISLQLATALDWGRLLVALLGLWLLMALLLALALLASACTVSAGTAAIGGFGAGLFLLLVRSSGEPGLLDYLSAPGHLRPFLEGRLVSADVVYFLALSAAAVLLSAWRLERLRGEG